MAINQCSYTTKTLIIRADADEKIGTGHLMRCLCLAKAWNGPVKLITTCTNSELLSRWDNVQVQVIVDPLSLQYFTPDSLVVLDGYSFDENYIKQITNTVLIIDDFNKLKHYPVDIILNQNFNTQLEYHCEPYTKLLLGPQYLLIRKEFKKLKKSPEINRVLVTMGGSDPENYTQKVINTLKYLGYKLKITVVVGASNNNLITRYPEITYIKNAQNMFELFKNNDLVITSAGTTMYECLCTGIQNIVIPITSQQKELVPYIEKYTKVCSRFTSRLSADDIAEYITNRPSYPDPEIDNMGTKRVISVLQNYVRNK